MIEGKRILITGVGSIGGELARQLAPKNELYLVDIDETRMFDLVEELKVQGRVGDVRDPALFQEINAFVANKLIPLPFDFIFHCAALKHVSPSESEPLEPVKTNIIGTANVIKFAQRTGAKLINTSTDKVINGESIMGLTKRIAEKMVKNAGFVSVRFGNILGSRGSVIPIWQSQLDRGAPLTITDPKMERFFMTIEEACHLLIRAAEISQDGTIMVMDMGERKNVLSIAKEILNKLGKPDHPIDIIGSRPGETLFEELMTPAERERAHRIEDFWVFT